jgi:ribose transport system substrate-binding protein
MKMRKLTLGLFAAAALGALVSPAWAEDKILAIVVKGLDNPFFEQIHLGC